jgi:nicotinamidase/pyrazinamidase
MKQKQIQLVIVDPQNDFAVNNSNFHGALYVNNAEESTDRICNLIDKIGHKLFDIQVSMDCHQTWHIAHPIFLINAQGKHPAPFTMISHSDIKSGTWMATIPALRKWVEYYTENLEKNGRYKLIIWPPHCRVGTPGSNIVEPLAAMLYKWENTYNAGITWKLKASNIKTEQYSIYEADVPDPEDKSTMLDTKLIERLAKSDELLIAGYASSHCVKDTTISIVNNFGDQLHKIFILSDCMKPVKGFEQQEIDFFNDMKSKGVNIMTSDEYMQR